MSRGISRVETAVRLTYRHQASTGLTASVGYAFVDTKVVSFVSTSEQFQPGQPLLRQLPLLFDQ